MTSIISNNEFINRLENFSSIIESGGNNKYILGSKVHYIKENDLYTFIMIDNGIEYRTHVPKQYTKCWLKAMKNHPINKTIHFRHDVKLENNQKYTKANKYYTVLWNLFETDGTYFINALKYVEYDNIIYVCKNIYT